VSDISERSRPFADRLVVDNIVTRAANDRSEWIGFFFEQQISKGKGMPQKLLGPSPHFVMLDDCEHGF
jgi:hypothetical protein